jgi:hypothetical protein
MPKLQKIAGQETLTNFWYSLCLIRRSIFGCVQGNIDDDPRQPVISPEDTEICQKLDKLQRCIRRASPCILISTALERLYLAQVVSLYNEATAKRKHAGQASERSLVDLFVTILFPEEAQNTTKNASQKARKKAKKKFNNYLEVAKPWARLVERFGAGILFLIPRNLTNEEWVFSLSNIYPSR